MSNKDGRRSAPKQVTLYVVTWNMIFCVAMTSAMGHDGGPIMTNQGEF